MKNKLYLLAFLGGCLEILAFPTKYGNGIPLIGVAGFFVLTFSISLYHSERSLKQDVISVLCFGLGRALVGHYWLAFTLKEFVHVPEPLNYLVLLIAGLFFAPNYLVFIFLIRLGRKYFPRLQLTGALSALVFTICEYYTPQLFPIHLGHNWLLAAPYLGLAPIFGVPIFSFFTCWIALAAASLYHRKEKNWAAAICFLIFVLANLFVPLNPKPKKSDAVTNIRMVQSNIGNYLKVSSEKGELGAQKAIDKVFEALSTKPMQQPLDLIIWPETAIYSDLYSAQKGGDAFIPSVVTRIANKMGVDILSGGYDNKLNAIGSFETTYNAVFLFSAGKLQKVYHKMKLMPFGETLPLGPLKKPLSRYMPGEMAFFAPGEKYTLFKARTGTTFITPICYEVISSQVIRNYIAHVSTYPNFMVNVTNDSWYGDTSEPHQHKWLSHWRALEFNLPIVRVTNTGISSVLYPDGTESNNLGLFKSGFLDIALETYENEATFFARFGIWPLIILVVIILLLLQLTTKPSFKRS